MEKWKFRLLILIFTLISILGFWFPVIDEEEEETQTLFRTYLKDFRRNYTENSENYEERYEAFKNGVRLTKEWNKKRSSTLSAHYGLTQFSDISPIQFSHRYLRGRSHSRTHNRTHYHHSRHHDTHNIVKRAIIDSDLPQVVDWRQKNAVNPIKDQKLCGACWAFSTVGVIEAMSAIKTGVLQTLSVQEVIDCARNGNMGCLGGDPCSLLEWLVENKVKLEPESSYPLLYKDSVCKLKKSNNVGVGVLNNFTCEYLVGREEKLLMRLATHGPVAVAVNALSWQFYLGGVIESNCDGSIDRLNHAVEIVGYDLTSPIPHYIIRNSWGKLFGEKGYVRVAIGNNVCGIGSEVASLDVVPQENSIL